jgi:hypothetical protein
MIKILPIVFIALVSTVACNGQKTDVPMRSESEVSGATQNNAYRIVTSNPSDSIQIEKMLQEAKKLGNNDNIPLHFARNFIGLPYVAHTLDRSLEESLVVNTRELDCTTFVENVLALTVCKLRNMSSFHDFCSVLTTVRYTKDEVAYTARQHYFTQWIDDNIKDGIVEEIKLPEPPLSQKRKPYVDFMTTHVEAYKMLNGHREWVPAIAEMEKQVNQMEFWYVPKEKLRDSQQYKEYIHDGDIIGIVTNKKGLDISHVGFAVWHKDGLHLMDASSIHKKVVDESITMYQYLMKQKSSVGIRVVRIQGIR